MKEQLQQRLEQLKTELEAGHRVRADLETKLADLRETLLRISGAIQVLEEELASPSEPPQEEPQGADGVTSGADAPG